MVYKFILTSLKLFTYHLIYFIPNILVVRKGSSLNVKIFSNLRTFPKQKRRTNVYDVFKTKV